MSYNPETGIVETIVQGIVNLAEMTEIMTEAVQAMVENEAFLYFADYRQGSLGMTTLQIHNMPKLLSEIAVPLNANALKFKRAIVVEKFSKDYQFYETVTINSGQTTKLFQDVDEARKWLLGK
jgi:hypothetical protein